MNQSQIAEWVQGATAPELAAFMSLAGARLVTLVGLRGEQGRNSSVTDLSRCVRVEEASRLTGMSRSWFYERGEAPFVRRLGRSIRIDMAALEASLGEARHE